MLLGRECRLENVLRWFAALPVGGLIRKFLLDVKEAREHAFLVDLVVEHQLL